MKDASDELCGCRCEPDVLLRGNTVRALREEKECRWVWKTADRFIRVPYLLIS